MPLIKCPACAREVSTQAEKCPQCGQPIHQVPVFERRVRPFGIFVGFLLLAVGLWLLIAFLPAHELSKEVVVTAVVTGEDTFILKPGVAKFLRAGAWISIAAALVQFVFYSTRKVQVR